MQLSIVLGKCKQPRPQNFPLCSVSHLPVCLPFVLACHCELRAPIFSYAEHILGISGCCRGVSSSHTGCCSENEIMPSSFGTTRKWSCMAIESSVVKEAGFILYGLRKVAVVNFSSTKTLFFYKQARKPLENGMKSARISSDILSDPSQYSSRNTFGWGDASLSRRVV